MKRSRMIEPGRWRRIVGDDGAQALTEFAIVIPVVLLLFLVMEQHLLVVRTAQLCNYAAYVAARSYAVHAAVDGDDAGKSMATKAAAYALAPVANPGFGLASLWPADSSVRHLAELLDGAVVAELRLQPAGGGRVDITKAKVGIKDEDERTHFEVRAEITYPQPLILPGLAEAWAMVAGEQGIHKSLEPLSEGLTGVPAGEMAVAEGIEWGQDLFNSDRQSFQTVSLSSIRAYAAVRARSATGYAFWGQRPEFRPRQPSDASSGTTSSPSSSQFGQQAQDNSAQLNQAMQDLKPTKTALAAAQQEVKTAQDNVDAAQKQLNKDAPGSQQATADQAKLTQAQTQLSAAQSVREQKQADYNQASGKVKGLQQQQGQFWSGLSP